MLRGLIKAVEKGYRVDSSYKSNGWKIALNCTLAVTQQLVTLQQLKSKHDSHKKEWKVWKELCGLSGWGQDEAKGVPVADEEVIEDYFEANLDALKYYDVPPAFLDLLERLFDGVLAIGDNARLIDEVIENCIDPELLAVDASQALDLAEEEGKKNEDDVGEDSELELARSSIKRSQLSSPLTIPRSSSLMPSRSSLIAIRKRAVKQAAREVKSNVKRHRGRRRVVDTLEETVEKVTEEIRATRELIA